MECPTCCQEHEAVMGHDDLRQNYRRSGCKVFSLELTVVFQFVHEVGQGVSREAKT